MFRQAMGHILCKQDGEHVKTARQRGKDAKQSQFEQSWLNMKGLEALPDDPNPPVQKPVQKYARKRARGEDEDDADGAAGPRDELGHTYW